MKKFYRLKWILFIPILFIIGLSTFSSCSESMTVPEEEPLSAVIYLYGQQITSTYSAWPIPENEEPIVDTTGIAFFTKFQSIHGDENQLRVYGLEGADVGKRGNQLFPGCEHPDECRITGTLINEEFSINLTNDGRSYQAKGFIYQTYDPYVEMTATYNYQNTTFEYELKGGVFDPYE